MARQHSAAARLLCLAALAALVVFLSGPAFVPAFQGQAQELATRASPVVAASVLASVPLAAHATSMPAPVMGVGMLSIIVVIVLIASAFAITRGLNEAIDDL